MTMNTKDQLKLIRQLFTQRKVWTSDQLRAEGITEVGERMSKIRKSGWDIKSELNGTGHRCKRYTLISKKKPKAQGNSMAERTREGLEKCFASGENFYVTEFATRLKVTTSVVRETIKSMRREGRDINIANGGLVTYGPTAPEMMRIWAEAMAA